MTELGAMCALCGEKADYDEMLGLALFPSEDPEASQMWLVHPPCARACFAKEALICVRPELAEPLGVEATEVEPSKLDHIVDHAIDLFGSARVMESELDDGTTLVVVPGDISNDAHWNELVNLHQVLDEEGLTDPGIIVVLRGDG